MTLRPTWLKNCRIAFLKTHQTRQVREIMTKHFEKYVAKKQIKTALINIYPRAGVSTYLIFLKFIIHNLSLVTFKRTVDFFKEFFLTRVEMKRFRNFNFCPKSTSLYLSNFSTGIWIWVLGMISKKTSDKRIIMTFEPTWLKSVRGGFLTLAFWKTHQFPEPEALTKCCLSND